MNVERVKRLFSVVSLLRSGRSYSADALADELDVSRRTVFRDLKLLEGAGIPFRFQHDAKGYRVENSLSLPPVHLTIEETLALLVSTRKMVSSDVHPLYRAAMSASLKIESGLPSAVVEHCGAWLAGLDVQWSPMSSAEAVDDLFRQLQSALAQHLRLFLVYDSVYDGEEIRLFVDPVRLIFATRGWYLIAWSHKHESYRTFKVDRIMSVEMTGDAFEPHKDFSTAAYFGDAWRMIPEGHTHVVRLRFSAIVAASVEEVYWHHTQHTDFDDKGRLLFSAKVDGLNEIAPWVLGYGEHVEVLGPVELRDLVRKKAEAIVANALKLQREPVA